VSSAQLGCGDRYILVDRRRRAEGSDGLVSAGFEFVTSAACSADEDFGSRPSDAFALTRFAVSDGTGDRDVIVSRIDVGVGGYQPSSERRPSEGAHLSSQLRTARNVAARLPSAGRRTSLMS